MTVPVDAKPQVSVVLPTYQRPVFLDRAIESVRSQTISDWELLVVDDNPPESDARRETEARMARYQADARIRYLVHDANRGASAARNTGIAQARADVVAFLDDDDAWLPAKLERQLERLRGAGDDVGAVFAGYRKVHASRTPDEDVIPPEDAGRLERLVEENRIGTTSSIACRRAALVSIGGFDPSLPASQDYDLYLRLATRYRIVRVEEVLLLSFRHGQGAIGDDPARKRTALVAFYEKHRALLEQRPRGHAHHLAWIGQRMLRYGFVDEAKRYLSASLRLVPLEPGRWLLLALCGLTDASRARLWRARRFVLAAIRRTPVRERATTDSSEGAVTASDGAKRPTVLRWGPYPHRHGVFGGGMGGYARYNSQALRSRLSERFDLRALPMTVPRFQSRLAASLHLPWRMSVDVVTVTRALVRQRPDVLHVTALYWRSIYREAYAVWLARRLSVPVLYDARAGTFDAFTTSAAWPARRLAAYVLRNSSRVSVQGRASAARLSEAFGVPVVWLPNCFLDRDLAAYPRAPLSEPGPGEPFRLAFVGYLIPEKGVDVLLEAAERLSRRTPVEVTLVGEGAPRFASTLSRYRSRSSERFRVVVTGRVDLDVVLSTLQEQHVFVFLSRFFGEGQPNAVTEAMAIGLPVVASRNGFLDELVGDECGIRFDDATDVDGVVEALDALRRDWPRLVEMGTSARERIVERYGESVVLDRTARLYRECVDLANEEER